MASWSTDRTIFHFNAISPRFPFKYRVFLHQTEASQSQQEPSVSAPPALSWIFMGFNGATGAQVSHHLNHDTSPCNLRFLALYYFRNKFTLHFNAYVVSSKFRKRISLFYKSIHLIFASGTFQKYRHFRYGKGKGHSLNINNAVYYSAGIDTHIWLSYCNIYLDFLFSLLTSH